MENLLALCKCTALIVCKKEGKQQRNPLEGKRYKNLNFEIDR